MTITLNDFDRAVAASRRNLEQLIAEQAVAEMLALQLLTEQIGQSEAARQRVDAEQRRAAAQDEFNANALATAQLAFADMHARANVLRGLATDAERLHDAIIAGALDLQRDAATVVKNLMDALPEPTDEAATDALSAAGLDGLRYSLPTWLQTLTKNRWFSPPSVDGWQLTELGRGFAKERRKKR